LAQNTVPVQALLPTAANPLNGQFFIAQAPNTHHKTVPEPGQIVGNATALGILVFLLRKPLKAAFLKGKFKP
jgi:hypothetical protein